MRPIDVTSPGHPRPFPGSTLGSAFAHVADAHSGRPAVIDAQRTWSYAQLAAAAGGVAEGLRRLPGEPARRVGLLLDHGGDLIAALLGALAAGWCYVPLDPSYPADRLRVMAAQAQLSAIVSHRRYLDQAGEFAAGVPTVGLEELAPAPLQVSDVDPGQPAYVLFTSGSTGRPKGVTHSHRSVRHGIGNHISNLEIGPGDRLSLVTSFSYDMSVSDLYGALLSGATVVPVDVRTRGLVALAAQLAAAQVTIYHSSPTVFRFLAQYLADPASPVRALPSVRVVLLGGEAATREDVGLARRHFSPRCRFVNGYGASEASFTVQLHLPAGVEPPGDPAQQVLPIGTPLRGYEVRLLDEQGQPLPDDAAGPAELAIESDFHGLGYWGEPELTAQRFRAGGRLYLTGDLVRRLPDGNLVYLGRADRQVKVNGHRVELGEIEAHAAALPGVARAVAAACASTAGTSQLHLYLQPVRGGALDAEQVRAHLARQLPAYLVPHRVLVVPELPLTSSGKVDVAALSAPPPVAEEAAGSQAAATGTEAAVTAAWCDALGVATVGRQVNFFDAGGTSLALTRLQYRLAQLTGVEVPLATLLAHPTVAGLVGYLAGEQGTDPLAVASARAARRRVARQARQGAPV